jgi:hypothetical protein
VKKKKKGSLREEGMRMGAQEGRKRGNEDVERAD